MLSKKLLALPAAFLILGAAGCSSVSTQSDQAGLHYKGGPFSSVSFANCVSPGTRNYDGPADKHYKYPAGQRTYEFADNQSKSRNKDDAPDTTPIKVVTVDNVELTVSGYVTFSLNTDCDTLRKFHEKIGLKYKAYMDGENTSDGWRAMLNIYFKQSMQRAMNESTQGLTWKQLYNDPATKAKWEADVKAKLPTYIKESMKENYFDGISVTIQKPQLPDELQKALEATQVSIEQNNAQQARNQQVQSELESIQKLVAVLGPDGYNVYQAIKDGKITVLPIPEGSGVVIQQPNK